MQAAPGCCLCPSRRTVLVLLVQPVAGSRPLADCTGVNELLVRLLCGKSYKCSLQPGRDFPRLYQPRGRRKPAPWRARVPCMSQCLPAAAPVSAAPVAVPAPVTPVAAPVSGTPIAAPVSPIGVAPVMAPPAPPVTVAMATTPVHLLDRCRCLCDSCRRRQQTGSRGFSWSSCTERECPRKEDGERVQSPSHHLLLCFLGRHLSYYGILFDTFASERHINRCPGNVRSRHNLPDNLPKIDADRGGGEERSPSRPIGSWK